ncbi:MAG: hypothetical protein AAFQ57_18080, partial [Cyanobacteria bacterium J06626_14]
MLYASIDLISIWELIKAGWAYTEDNPEIVLAILGAVFAVIKWVVPWVWTRLKPKSKLQPTELQQTLHQESP